MTPPTPALVIFDCDGVLVDSETPVIAAEAALLREIGVPLSDAEAAELFVGLTIPLMREAAAARGLDIPEDFWAQRRRVVHDQGILESVGPIPGIAAVVDAVVVPRCLASSSGHERIATTLAAAGLLDRFPPAIRFSAQDVDRGKPFPDLFLHAAVAMGVAAAACVVVEDSVPGVTAGAAAGMTVIGLTAGGHCPPGHATRLREAGATAVAADAAGLRAELAARGAT